MGTGMKLSLGRAAKAAGASKATLLKALGAGELTGTKGADGIWSIDAAEVARWRENREKPQRGRRPEPTAAPEPEPAPASDNVELAVERERTRQLEERLAETKEALAAATARADAAQKRADEAVARVVGLLLPPKRSWWSRFVGK